MLTILELKIQIYHMAFTTEKYKQQTKYSQQTNKHINIIENSKR